MSTYNGSEINSTGGTVYTSSITIKDYFTAENPIDKFIINGTEYSIFDQYTNKIDLDDFNFENNTSNEVYGTKWNDEIWSRSGGSTVNGDTIYAGEGDDKIISGGSWLNSLYGENGDDEIIIGANGVLADGGAGDDTITHRESGTINPNGTRIIGGIGNDELQGSSYTGIKTIFEFKKGDGQDKVTSTSGNDIIKITDCEHSAITYEKDGDNILIKYGESDVITVKDALKNLAKIMIEDQNGNQVNMAEQLNIYIGDGIVTGSDGNDTLYGRDNVDTITGKKGDDLLVGNKGSDTFVFNNGDGIDTVVRGKDGVNDKLKFNDIDDVRDFEFNIADNEKDLVISYGNNDKVIVQNYFEYGNTVTTWVDKNGIEHAIATDNNHSINDTYSASITGTIFNDYITVNALNKSIAGGEGANTYVITADNVARTITTISGRDTIKFTDIDLSDLTFDKEGTDVTIKGDGVNITLKNYFVNMPELLVSDNTTTAKVIEQLASAGIIYSDDETVLGTDNSEEIFGGDSNNTLIGKKGNDILNAGKGNDTYQFTKGDGYDSVINGTEANEVDTIFFIDSELSELTYSKSGNDLIINYSNSDSVTIKNYYTDANTVKKFKVFDYDLSDYVEYDIEKDLKNNIHATTTTVSGTEKNDRIWGTAGEDTISDDKGFNEFIGGNGADTYLINGYGEGIADTVHNTIVMGADNVVDTIKLVDNNFYGNSGNFQFDKVGDDLRIWYNYDTDIVKDASFISGVNKYNGTEIYNTGAYAYCSSLIIKDYFKSTAENCTIDKFVLVNKEGERQFSILENYQGTFDLDDMDYDMSSSNTFYGTRWNDSIWSRSGGSTVNGDTIYAGDGNDIIINGGGWRDSFYGENGNDEILIGCNGVLADGGAGDDKITHNRSGSYSPDGTILRGGTGNDTLTSHYDSKVTSIFEFKTGDGNDIINYEGNKSIIKFTDVEITDITFGEYDLENKTFTMSYGTSDKITVNGLTPQVHTLKIEDKNGTQYTVYLGYGDDNTKQQAKDGENVIFIGSTGRDGFRGNSGINVFANGGYGDYWSGSLKGENIYILSGDLYPSIYNFSDDTKIIFKDLTLSQLDFELDLNSDATVNIIDKENSETVSLSYFVKDKANTTIIDKNGDSTTILDELPIIYATGETLDGTEGTDGQDILIGSGLLDKVDTIVGGKGDDTLFGGSGSDLYIFNKGDGNDVLGKYCGDDATLRFNDSTYEELSFKQLSGNKYQVTYNDGADSVIFYNDQVTKFIVKDTTVEGGYKEYSMATDMQQYIKGDGIETNLMGSDINDIFTGTSINETMTGGKGSNIYNFTTGGGTDTVVISTNTDTINFTDVETGDLTFDINGEDLVINYGSTDKVIIKDYVTELQTIAITGANSTSTTALAGFGTTGAQIVNETTATGTANDDYIICTDIDNTITGGKGNDTLSGAGGNNTYIFNKGDGNDTIKYSIGNDVIKFNDVNIKDITFGDYDLTNKTVTLSYGTSDSLTITGLQTDRNTVKIEDSTGTQYTVIVGDGDNSVHTIQKANAGENVVFISSTGGDSFDGNTGINVFTNPNNFDYNTGALNSTNIFLVQPETNGVIWGAGNDTKIYFKDLDKSELQYKFSPRGKENGDIIITNTKNSQEIELANFLSNRTNPIVVDKDGDETKILDNIDIVFGDEGTANADIICSNTDNGVISGNGGSDLIIARCSNATIYSNKEGVKDTTVGTVVTINTGNNSEYNIYAQSETNIINHQAPQYDDGINYYVYSDQKTTITETANQPYSALHFLNTDDVNDIDGIHTNLNIVFNVSKDYKTVQGATAIGDVKILDDNNFANWVNGSSYKDITLKQNCIETINSSDGYSITSEQIAQIAENVASWLTTNDFVNVNEAMSGGTTEQIAELTAFFRNDANWTAMP